MQANRTSRVEDVAIVAGTLTGNRGAEAMATTCIEQIRERFPTARIHVLTYYPAADRREALPPNVFVHSATPVRLVLDWLPWSLICVALPSLRQVAPRQHGAGMRSLLSVNAVWDVAGVSFIDGREKFLPFNVLTLLPFLLHDVPVFKVSQAMGPITSIANRVAARFVVRRCARVVARGARTHDFLRSSGIREEKLLSAPDVSFLLQLPEARRVPYVRREQLVGIAPSSLVAGSAPRYVEAMADLTRALLSDGCRVRLIAHSWRSGTDQPRNNDLPVAREIARIVGNDSLVSVVGEGLGARELKEEIGKCRLLVTSRFHAMVASLHTATPPVVVGWSHKYQEVLEAFGLTDVALQHDDHGLERLISLARSQLEQGEQISARIAGQLADVERDARAALDAFTLEMGGTGGEGRGFTHAIDDRAAG